MASDISLLFPMGENPKLLVVIQRTNNNFDWKCSFKQEAQMKISWCVYCWEIICYSVLFVNPAESKHSPRWILLGLYFCFEFHFILFYKLIKGSNVKALQLRGEDFKFRTKGRKRSHRNHYRGEIIHNMYLRQISTIQITYQDFQLFDEIKL